MKISKNQRNEVTQSLLKRIDLIAEENLYVANVHYAEADRHEEDTLGYHSATVDANKAYVEWERFSSAIDVVIKITGIPYDPYYKSKIC
jgi:hypothetical protein|tara:strand:+ start:216 stop:482 length:267 start_codon:yes stop_codon:yes gene_type:complete